ncbi:MAG TPA: DUF922 domain-containing protein [Gemmatimonadaceae bacterium]
MSRAATVAALVLAAACAGGMAARPADVPSVGTGAAGVQSSSIVHEYTITASTPASIVAELERMGPTVEGRSFAGATQWSVRWTYRYERVGGGCALRDVRAFVASTIRLPKWQPAAPPDSATRAWWADFRPRLAEHEAGHARHGVDAATEVVRALRMLTGGSCDALGMHANDLGRTIIDRARARDAAYDRETAHGARQPGFAPPPRLLLTDFLPPMGVAVLDTAGRWCAEFPERRAVPERAVLTIVLLRPADTVAVRALAVRRRASACATAFAQPRWASYVAYDLALLDSARTPATMATLVFAGRYTWTRGADGVPRALLDRDTIPEEVRSCLGGEGEHFTVWSVGPAGERRIRGHEYFDHGGLVDANCSEDEMRERPGFNGN